ncbi:MAG: hypothetical protein ACFFC1_20350 [Promethearchaeota archaeon]
MLKNNIRIKLLSISVLAIILINMLSIPVYGITYQVALKKGTEQFVIEQYNDSAWKSTVDGSLAPNEWFEGDANVTGAKSKITVKGWNYRIWEAYDAFTTIFLPKFFSTEDLIPLLGLLELQGYNETTINTNYTNNYRIWYGIRSVWNYTDSTFKEEPSYTEGILVLQNPLDYIKILDDYNNLASELNSNPIITGPPYFYNFPNLIADDFLWMLAFNGLALARPFPEYAENLINGLGCENVSFNFNVNNKQAALIFNKTGITNYTVEIYYGPRGTLSKFVVKDIADDTIYQIISRNSEWIFYTILIIIVAGITGLIGYTILRKKKLKR